MIGSADVVTLHLLFRSLLVGFVGAVGGLLTLRVGALLVFGRFDSAADASALLEQVLHVGFRGSLVEPDGCGLLKVDVHGIPTLKVGGQVVEEARSVGLHATVEQVG